MNTDTRSHSAVTQQRKLHTKRLGEQIQSQIKIHKYTHTNTGLVPARGLEDFALPNKIQEEENLLEEQTSFVFFYFVAAVSNF